MLPNILPYGYNPERNGGKIWWNENHPAMREMWGTQEDYDNFKKQGGTWREYYTRCIARAEQRRKQSESVGTNKQL